MRRILICTVAFLFSFGISFSTHASSEDWRNDKECGKRLPVPSKTDIAGCQKAYCSQLSETSRICSCLASIENDEGNIFIERSGKIVQRWNANTPYFERPVIYRRYLMSFQQQRNKAFSIDQPKPGSMIETRRL